MLSLKLLKQAVEVLRKLEPGQAYVTSQTPSDAKIDEGARGGKIWYPAQYAAQKEKTKGKTEPTNIAELISYVKENHSKLYEAMQQQLPDLSDDQLKEQITTSKKRLRGLDKGRDAYKIHQLAIAMSEQEQSKRQKGETSSTPKPKQNTGEERQKTITVGAIKQTVPYTPKEKLVPYKRDVYDSLEKRGYTEDEIYFVLRMFTDKPTKGNWEDGIPNATQLKSIVSTGIYGIKNAKDQANVGTNKYKGIAYFHDREYKYQMRGASNKQRREAHKKLLAAGLDPSGKSDKHYEIITSVVEDSLPW